MEIIMPKMGESITEGTILKWYKSEGDSIKKDEVLLEISTDKVDTEVPCPEEGIVSKILFKENEVIEVGKTIAILITKNDDENLRTNTPASVIPNEESNSSKASSHSAGEKNADLISTYEVVMPKMGESLTEGTLLKWHKQAGEFVKKDEIIFEISTDKVDTEVTSPVEGTIIELLIKEQETVPVGTLLAKISTTEAVSTSSKESTGLPEQEEAFEEPDSMHSNFSNVVRDDSSEDKEINVYLSPLVSNIVAKNNITPREIASIKGSGLNGRITKNDVLDVLKNRKVESYQTKVSHNIEKPTVKGEHRTSIDSFNNNQLFISSEIEKIPMDNIRQKIMMHMVNSRDTAVHVTAAIDVDMNRIYKYLQSNKDKIKESSGINLTYMAFISWAAIKALKEFPLVNSTIDGNSILVKKFINLGIAVSVEPNGLIVPNIKNAGDKNILGLAKEIKSAADKARNKKLVPDDIMNGTFTLTNYGVFGSTFGTPIINQPESAILGVGAVIKKPVVITVEDEDIIAIRPIMTLTLAHDHRLIDGMLGGRFLKFVKDTLENFKPELI